MGPCVSRGETVVLFGRRLVDSFDFVSVHFYPKKGEVEQALRALKAY